MKNYDIDHKNKCPQCGSNMDYIYGDMVCSRCGYRESYTKTIHQPEDVMSSDSIDEPNTIKPEKMAKALKGKKRKIQIGASIISIVSVITFMVPYVWDAYSSYKASSESPVEALEKNKFPILSEALDTLAQYQFATNSKGLNEVLSLIFQKDMSEITAEELATVYFLNFTTKNGEKVVEYELFNPDSYDVWSMGEVCPQDDDFSNMNFSVLPNLNSLYMEYGSIKSLDGLSKLHMLGTDLTPSEIATFMDPEQLYALALQDLSGKKGLSGIGKFEKLVRLSMEMEGVTDISELSELDNLEALNIIDGNDIESFQVLNNMQNLRYVSIDSSNLESIEFVTRLPLLNSLQIYNSKVKDISCLSSCCDSLENLNLCNNYDVKNYEVISDLTNLIELVLFVNYEEEITLPKMNKLTNLTSLYLGGFDDLLELSSLDNLESLAVYNSSVCHLPVLPTVKQLGFYNVFIDSETLDVLMGMELLNELYFEKSQICGSIEEVFKLSELQQFGMENCVAGFNPANLPQNSELNFLNLNYAELRNTENKNYHSLDELEPLPLAENTAIFESFPKLRYLYIAGQGMEDVTFVSSLSRIQEIDLRDNNITDLSPLDDLRYLSNVIK